MSKPPPRENARTATGRRITDGTEHQAPPGMVIIYGHGAGLGDFNGFAMSLTKMRGAKYGKRIVRKEVERKVKLFEFLEQTDFEFQIEELHIFSHSFGGGLALGYHLAEFERARIATFDKVQSKGRVITAKEVLESEVGILFVEDLQRAFFLGKQKKIQARLTKGAFVKIWGCNSGVADWEYTDDDYTGDGVPDVYWTALNTSPKRPCIAQAVANYFQVPAYGARSGSHVEVLVGGKWITSDAYKKTYGHYANPARVLHRLAPDRGVYHKYVPK